MSCVCLKTLDICTTLSHLYLIDAVLGLFEVLKGKCINEVVRAACVFDRQFEKQPFVGMYKFLEPVLLVRDPECIRDVFVKNFSSFNSQERVLKPGEEPVFEENPFFVDGER